MRDLYAFMLILIVALQLDYMGASVSQINANYSFNNFWDRPTTKSTAKVRIARSLWWWSERDSRSSGWVGVVKIQCCVQWMSSIYCLSFVKMPIMKVGDRMYGVILRQQNTTMEKYQGKSTLLISVNTLKHCCICQWLLCCLFPNDVQPNITKYKFT